jgi:hypothetical protein
MKTTFTPPITKTLSQTFDPAQYIKDNIKIQDVEEAKQLFDLFDVAKVGVINPKCIVVIR